MRPDDEYLDEEAERTYPRSLLASGWVRALLVLGGLVLVLFVALPYVLRSGDRQPPEQLGATVKPASSPAPTPSAAPPATTTPAGTATPSVPPVAPSVAQTPAPAAPAPAGPAPAKTERRETVAAREQAKAPPKAPADTPRTPAPARAPRESVAAAAAGEFWVQAGAFESEKNAERLVERLRRDRLDASVSRITRSADAAGRHEIVVTGANAGAVNTLLQGKGSARAIPGAVVVEPALELKDAVALSKRLAAEGLTVKIRRVSNGPTATVHVVSVGPYPTRAGAEAAAKELAAQGVRGFVRQGPAR